VDPSALSRCSYIIFAMPVAVNVGTISNLHLLGSLKVPLSQCLSQDVVYVSLRDVVTDLLWKSEGY